jgi:chromosomal replication initiation ATPase DnaA
MNLLIPSEFNAVCDVVCTRCGVTMNQLRGKDRTEHVARARQIVFYIMRRLTSAGSQALAERLNRDYTSVLHSQRTIENLRSAYSVFNANVAAIETECAAAIQQRRAA